MQNSDSALSVKNPAIRANQRLNVSVVTVQKLNSLKYFTLTSNLSVLNLVLTPRFLPREKTVLRANLLAKPAKR